jgi:cysteine synthase A
MYVKPEGMQTGGSMKYRMVYAKLVAALEGGELHSDSTLIEATAGSTGIALAYLGQKLGVKVELHAYENVSPDKCARIRECGARLVLYSSEIPFNEILARVLYKSEDLGYWHLNQYDRKSTAKAYIPFGAELVSQIRELALPPPAVFVCPVGTGGLIQGLGKYLRDIFPRIRIVSVEPDPAATIDGMRNTDKLYMGENDPYDRSFPDERVLVPAPLASAYIGSCRLGASASAVYQMVRTKAWENVLMVAPD